MAYLLKTTPLYTSSTNILQECSEKKNRFKKFRNSPKVGQISKVGVTYSYFRVELTLYFHAKHEIKENGNLQKEPQIIFHNLNIP